MFICLILCFLICVFANVPFRIICIFEPPKFWSLQCHISSVRLQEACRGAIECAVRKEQDAGLLVQILIGRLKLGKGEDKVADVSIVIRVAQRASSLIKQDPNLASDAFLEALENSEELVPPDVEAARDMQAVLGELQQVIRKSISIRNGEVEEEEEAEGEEEET